MTTQFAVTALTGAAAILTALATLFTGWLTRRHEHRRWLLDQRLKAYLDANKAWLAWLSASGYQEETRAAVEQLVDSTQVILLVSPSATRRVAQELLTRVVATAAATGDDRARLINDLTALQAKVLKQQRADVQANGWLARRRRKHVRAPSDAPLARPS